MNEEEKKHGGTVLVNGKTMAYALALFLGGGLGGGSVSLTSGPSKEDFAALKSSVESVALAAVEIKAELRTARKERGDIEKDLEDHEKRIRELERHMLRAEEE